MLKVGNPDGRALHGLVQLRPPAQGAALLSGHGGRAEQDAVEHGGRSGADRRAGRKTEPARDLQNFEKFKLRHYQTFWLLFPKKAALACALKPTVSAPGIWPRSRRP